MALNKITLYKVLKYFLFFILFLILGFAEIDGMHPFLFGMLFALVWCNQKIYIVTPLYFLAGALVDYSTQNLLSLAVTCFVFVLFYFLHKKFGKPLNKVLIGLYAFLSQTVFLFLHTSSGNEFFVAVCSVVVGMICLYAYLFFMQGLFVRGLRRKLLLDECICAGVLFLALGVGLCSIPDYQLLISKFLLVLLIIFLSFCLEKTQGFAFAILLAFGALIHGNDYALFLSLLLMSFVLLITSNSKKLFTILGIILADAFVNLYFFNFYDLYLFLPTFAAGICSFCVPNKTYKKIKNYFIFEKEDFCVRDVVNQTRKQLFKKLFEVKDVFKEMQQLYLAMSKKELNPEDAIETILEQVNCNICKNCSNKSFCPYSQTIFYDESMKTVISLALSRGKLSVIDVPPIIMKKCQKINVLINELNNLVTEYNKYSIINSSVNSSKLLLAEQLEGVQDVLLSLSKDVNKKIGFDVDLENKIMEELMLENVLCCEVFVCGTEKAIDSVTLNVKTRTINNVKIEQVVSKILKTKMKIFNLKKSEKPGFSLIKLKVMNNYDIIFGSSQQTKWGSTISGDTFSVVRLNDEKVFMSLCDGMGSGSGARNISMQSLNLIQKFYEAGFGSGLIIKNVNKLLSLRNEDDFSAIDICVFDLNNASCRLIKIGATVGFIKEKNQTKMIESSALPLGILDSIEPAIDDHALSCGDMVILLSDGVVDSWEDIMDLKNLINNTETENPQTLADVILQESLRQTQNYAEDDMTVVVGKIWQKL